MQSFLFSVFSCFLCFDNIRAITPTKNGHAIDVPFKLAYELFKNVLYIFTPGAAHSTFSPREEKLATLPNLSCAATAIVSSNAAGQLTPPSPVFPAAQTTGMFISYNFFILLCKKEDGTLPPKLIDTMSGFISIA